MTADDHEGGTGTSGERRRPVDTLLDAFQAAWGERRRGAFHEVCAPDLHWEDPFCAEPLYGPDALADHAAQLWEAFPDSRTEAAGERLDNGRFIALPLRVTGTHLGELEGLVPTRKVISVHAVLYCELDPPRERLWRVRVFLDAYDAATQLGVLPKRGSVSEKALMVVRGFGLKLPF